MVRDLPLPKTPKELILASRRWEFGECQLKGLRPQGAFGVFGMVLAQQRDHDPHFNSGACIGYILPESKTI